MAAYKKNLEKLKIYLIKRDKEKKDANIQPSNKVTK
jgi:hypothetical protein